MRVLNKFKKALIEVSQFLAKAIAADGEGATKLIEVDLKGAPSLEIARRAARGVTMSPLVKTAMHGEDPNWVASCTSLGQEMVPRSALDKMTLKIQGVTLFEKGMPIEVDREAVRTLLNSHRSRWKLI